MLLSSGHFVNDVGQNILPTFKMVDTCAAEFEAKTPYCYSSYEIEIEIKKLSNNSIIIFGGRFPLYLNKLGFQKIWRMNMKEDLNINNSNANLESIQQQAKMTLSFHCLSLSSLTIYSDLIFRKYFL